VTDLFRGMTVSHNPNFLQELPAEKKHNLKTNSEFVAMTEELESLKKNLERIKTAASRAAPEETQANGSRESTPQQPRQRFNPLAVTARFALFCRLTPERRRLAKIMFVAGSLRSPEGRSVLQDRIALLSIGG
jgi:hypothetical protein